MSSTHVLPVNREVMIERKMHIIECATCSVDFGIGGDFMARRREDHQGFYCPNGHSNVYRGKSDIEKRAATLERELDAARSLAAREARRRSAAEDEARRQDYRARAAKAALTRARRREAAGMCPVDGCRRTFTNLADHMAGVHPAASP